MVLMQGAGTMSVRTYLPVTTAVLFILTQQSFATPLYDMSPMLNQWQSVGEQNPKNTTSKQVTTKSALGPTLYDMSPMLNQWQSVIGKDSKPVISKPTMSKVVSDPTPIRRSTNTIVKDKSSDPPRISISDEEIADKPIQPPKQSTSKSEKHKYYVSFGAGAVFLQDSSLSVPLLPALTGELTFDTGFLVRGALGLYLKNNFRTEFEIAYRRNSFDEASLSFAGTTLVAGSVSGAINATSFMANGFYDIPIPGKFTPYIGIGLGGSLLSSDGFEDFEFAYQAIGGASYALSSRLSLTGDYRFHATSTPSFSVTEAEYDSHNVSVGMMYKY
jgi:opacity protein-like surface antigen